MKGRARPGAQLAQLLVQSLIPRTQRPPAGRGGGLYSLRCRCLCAPLTGRFCLTSQTRARCAEAARADAEVSGHQPLLERVPVPLCLWVTPTLALVLLPACTGSLVLGTYSSGHEGDEVCSSQGSLAHPHSYSSGNSSRGFRSWAPWGAWASHRSCVSAPVRWLEL